MTSPPSDEHDGAKAAPPGWYTAPDMVDTLQYWDGQQWTQQFAPQPIAAQPTSPSAPNSSDQQEGRSKSWSPRNRLRLVAVAFLILTAVLGFASFSTSDGIDCGSLFSQSSDPVLEDADNELDELTGGTDEFSIPADNRVECQRAFDSQKPYVFGALGVAILAGVVSQVASSRAGD